MAKMKYYLGEIHEQIGEREFAHVIRFKTPGNPNAVMTRIAKHWYEAKPDMDDNGTFIFDDSSVWIGESQELSASAWKEIYLVMQLTGKKHGE